MEEEGEKELPERGIEPRLTGAGESRRRRELGPAATIGIWVRVCGEKGKGEAAVSSWEDKGERRTRVSRQSRMAGTWRRWLAAATRAARGEAKQREGGKGRLTSGPGVGFLFYFIFFLGCDSDEGAQAR